MMKYHWSFFLLVYFAFLVLSNDVAGADSTTLTCRTGWTEDSETTPIPKEWINDGYCDCPFDGKDEPDTNACSGSFFWPGVESSSASSETPSAFICQKQPDVVVPRSRLNDGICDCCDGSDEDPRHDAVNNNSEQQQKRIQNPCPDDCERVLRAERERKAKIRNNYLIGSRKRDIDLVKFSELRSQKTIEISKKEEEREAILKDIENIEGNLIVKIKEDYARSRAATMKNLVLGSPMAKALVSGLETKELKDFLVPLCQVAGEIWEEDRLEDEDNTNHCLALRVAALDIGLTWSGGGSNLQAGLGEPTSATIASILFENAMEANARGQPALRFQSSPSSKKKPRRTPQGRRRLDEMDDDYDDYEMMLPDDEMMPHDDTLYAPYDDDYEEDIPSKPPSRGSQNNGEEKEKSEGENEIIIEVRASLFSTTRAKFLKESQEILGEITKILDDAEQSEEKEGESDNENDGDEVEEELETDGTTEARIDVAPYTALRNSLREKREIIETGLSWGVSAVHLLDAPMQEQDPSSSVSTSRTILETLFIGTIFYGQISALQLWQIFQSILPEYKASLEDFIHNEAETTCASPWAGSCPPKSVQRLGAEYPPPSLIEIAESFCDEEASNFGNEASQTTLACQKKNDGNDDDARNVIESLVSIPTGEGNQSYFGYTVPAPRDQGTDPFQNIFEPIVTLPVDVQGFRVLEGKRDMKEKEHGAISNVIKKSWKEIGGNDQDDLGRDGELHPIVDQCFEVVAGKYTYETCISGKAQQKEGDKKSGTTLGNWKGIEYYDDDEERDGIVGSTRALMWENGAKCWNGPKRSATVYMTCGPEHKVISANEPDTCRYVFEMESYLACDERYKVRLGL